MTSFLIAHLSDAHIGPLPEPRARELIGKRLTPEKLEVFAERGIAAKLDEDGRDSLVDAHPRIRHVAALCELAGHRTGGAFAAWLAHEFRRAHIEVGVSFSGILMALVLFILARVFREGARMREDLEGTV